jgi:hypothetical protein
MTATTPTVRSTYDDDICTVDSGNDGDVDVWWPRTTVTWIVRRQRWWRQRITKMIVTSTSDSEGNGDVKEHIVNVRIWRCWTSSFDVHVCAVNVKLWRRSFYVNVNMQLQQCRQVTSQDSGYPCISCHATIVECEKWNAYAMSSEIWMPIYSS